MGSEALCRVTSGGTSANAKVLLETDEILIRAPFRLRIPLREIVRTDVDGPHLRLLWGTRAISIELGPNAAKWASKIANPKSVADKLGIRQGHRISIAGTLDQAFIDDLNQRGADVALRVRKDSDLIFLAAQKRGDLERLVTLRKSLVANGGIWVIRPKGSKAITEQDVMDAGRRAGLVDVKVVRFSETHTAEKLVIPLTRR